MTLPESCRHLEIESNAFYDRLSDLRDDPPEQVIELLKHLFLGSSQHTDPELVRYWNCIAHNADFPDRSVAFFNRSCHILINRWRSKLGKKEFNAKLVQLFKKLAHPRFHSQLSWGSEFLKFGQSAAFQVIEQRDRIDNPPEGDPRKLPLKKLVYRYPFLYTGYFTRFENGSENREQVKQLKEDKEQEFDAKLLRLMRWLSRYTGTEDVDPSVNPTLLSTAELSAAVHEFTSSVNASHDYQASAKQCLEQIQRSSSNLEMKAHIQDYLVDGVRTYEGLQEHDRGSVLKHFTGWLKQQLGDVRVGLDRCSHSPRMIAQTCKGLLDSLLASPGTNETEDRKNHLLFIDLLGNLKETFITGLILKILLLCRGAGDLEALRSSVSLSFLKLFHHYENHSAAPQSGMTSAAVRASLEKEKPSASWLVNIFENYMVASSICFSPRNDLFTWRQMLQA